MINTAKDLKNHILRRLGAPIINIEVTEPQIFDCIQRALQLFGEYHYNGVNKSFKVLKVDETNYIHGVFDLSKESVFAITSILRGNSGNLMTMDGSATYPWVTDFIMGFTGFGGGCKSIGMNSFGGDLGYYTMLNQYWNQMQDIMNPVHDYWYNDATGQLKLIGDLKVGDIVVIECYVKSYVDVDKSTYAYAGSGYAGINSDYSSNIGMIYDNPNREIQGIKAGDDSSLKQGVFNDRWVQDYTTALVKEINGQVLAKHQGMQLPGGVTVDGLRLLEEARYEKERLREELDLLSAFPIYIG